VGAIGSEWAASDPIAALTWMSQLSRRNVKTRMDGKSGHDSLLTVFGTWVGESKDAARTWADALPPGDLRDSVQKQLARALAEQGEPAEASKVLAQFGGAADPKIAADVAKSWARRDPQAAADWAIAQPAGAAQSGAIASVVRTWANDAPKGVGVWLAQFPPGEARTVPLSPTFRAAVHGCRQKPNG